MIIIDLDKLIEVTMLFHSGIAYNTDIRSTYTAHNVTCRPQDCRLNDGVLAPSAKRHSVKRFSAK
jgi:hypothetical protein